MKQQPNRLRRASALLLAAAALPLTPLLAQETPAPEAPVVDITPPPAPSLPPPTVEADMPAPATVTPPAATTTSPRLAPAPITESAEPPRTRVRATAPARPRATAPANDPAPAAPAEPAPTATVDAAPAAEALPVAGAPLPAAEPEALPVDTAEATPATETGGGSILPWLIGGLLLAGALFLLLGRRRRKDDLYEESYEETYEPAEYAPAVATAAEPAPLLGVPLAAPLASTAADEPVEAAPVVAPAASEIGRPWLDLSVKPRRAGVTGEDAVVEFELDVENHGSAAAQDVRISTWMFPAGSSGETEMERMLIDRSETSDSAALPETTIEAGAGKRIETAVALSTAGLTDDAVLPVVVAEARYRLPDGSEGRTSARFAVGVPDGEELAHFATENPSGLHDEVEARPLGELERI